MYLQPCPMAHCRHHHHRKSRWLPESCSFLYGPCFIGWLGPSDINECWRLSGNESDRGFKPCFKSAGWFSAYHSCGKNKSTDRTKKVPINEKRSPAVNGAVLSTRGMRKPDAPRYCFSLFWFLRSSPSYPEITGFVYCWFPPPAPPVLWMKQLKPRGTN